MFKKCTGKENARFAEQFLQQTAEAQNIALINAAVKRQLYGQNTGSGQTKAISGSGVNLTRIIKKNTGQEKPGKIRRQYVRIQRSRIFKEKNDI